MPSASTMKTPRRAAIMSEPVASVRNPAGKQSRWLVRPARPGGAGLRRRRAIGCQGASEVFVELRDGALEMRQGPARGLARPHRLGELAGRQRVFLVDLLDHVAARTGQLGVK